MVKMILDNTSIGHCNSHVRSMMNMALDSGKPQVVALFIQHNDWEKFLTVEQYSNTDRSCTLMRRLITEMPEIASLVMDKCWKLQETGTGKTKKQDS